LCWKATNAGFRGAALGVRTAAWAAGTAAAAATTTTSASSRSRIGRERDERLIGASGDVCDWRKDTSFFVVGRALPELENARLRRSTGVGERLRQAGARDTFPAFGRAAAAASGFGVSSSRDNLTGQ